MTWDIVVNESPTPMHAVNNASMRLEKKGFVHLSERDSWVCYLDLLKADLHAVKTGKIKPNGKYFVTRGGGSVSFESLPLNSMTLGFPSYS